jgi:hypothetical protein
MDLNADQFRALQEHLELTNGQIAEELACSVKAVEKWRAGDRNLSSRTVRALELLLETKGINMRQKLEELQLQRTRDKRKRKENARIKSMILAGELETRFFEDHGYLRRKAEQIGWSIGRLKNTIERVQKLNPTL